MWWTVGGLMAVAVASGIAEHRRRNRRDMDKVGIMPWPFIQFMALIGAAIAGWLAMKGVG
ncbi:hypothetical protein [Sphingomonas sp.]|uniref:hypothetical protein n=1 Tax=Sphingomonas sp. TaxID=28214 RepID=UPI001B2E688F|nr:hypothetical protein [Sphingomonas sp.]MBO9715221.1 hypothetical protein [Sphingomonas sp.]